MGQLIRQISVVVGLTVILTFPVTVVSGAGSQKHSDHVRSGASSGKTPALVTSLERRTEPYLTDTSHGVKVAKEHKI